MVMIALKPVYLQGNKKINNQNILNNGLRNQR